MILLDAVDVRKRYGPDPVLEGVTFELRPGDRVGLVGPNGSGKTTLLRILAGKDDADAGSYQLHPTAHLGYLEQQPYFEPGRTLHDEARSALADLLSLQHEAEEVARAIGETSDPAEGWTRPGMRVLAPAGSKALALFSISTMGPFRSTTDIRLRCASSRRNWPYRTRTALYPSGGCGAAVTSSKGEGSNSVILRLGRACFTVCTICSMPAL